MRSQIKQFINRGVTARRSLVPVQCIGTYDLLAVIQRNVPMDQSKSMVEYLLMVKPQTECQIALIRARHRAVYVLRFWSASPSINVLFPARYLFLGHLFDYCYLLSVRFSRRHYFHYSFVNNFSGISRAIHLSGGIFNLYHT